MTSFLFIIDIYNLHLVISMGEFRFVNDSGMEFALDLENNSAMLMCLEEGFDSDDVVVPASVESKGELFKVTEVHSVTSMSFVPKRVKFMSASVCRSAFFTRECDQFKILTGVLA